MSRLVWLRMAVNRGRTEQIGPIGDLLAVSGNTVVPVPFTCVHSHFVLVASLASLWLSPPSVLTAIIAELGGLCGGISRWHRSD